MTDLPPSAIEHLYPVLTIIAVAVIGLATLIGGLWGGFVWLRGQIKEVATDLLRPVIERLAMVERTADAAHRRIDEIVGRRP